MQIRFLHLSSNARGVFHPGDVVDWSERDAKPLVERGHAELVTVEPVKPEPTTRKRGGRVSLEDSRDG